VDHPASAIGLIVVEGMASPDAVALDEGVGVDPAKLGVLGPPVIGLEAVRAGSAQKAIDLFPRW
jgi:hypothetical protein